MIDGEIVIDGADGLQDFDALSYLLDPAASLIERLFVSDTPALFLAFDLLATEDSSIVSGSAVRGAARGAGGVPVRPAGGARRRACAALAEAERWLRSGGGRDREGAGGAVPRPGGRDGMAKIKRLRTIDAVVIGWRPGKQERTVCSLDPRARRRRRRAAHGRSTRPG